MIILATSIGPNINFNINEYPGTHELSENNPADVVALRQCSSLIFVIDAHEQDKDVACNKFFEIMKVAYKVNPQIIFEVFIHKVDPDMYTQDDQKFDTLNEISMNMRGMLREFGLGSDALGVDANNIVRLHYNLTSIYDLTIYQALSQVVQKMLPQVQFITQLMDNLVKQSQIQKAFLFDVKTKIHIATDENPVEIQDYEICSELIDVLIDVSSIYGTNEAGEALKFDDKSSSSIRLHHPESEQNVMLYLKEVDKSLALVCLINENKMSKQHLINYNIDQFKVGLKQIFKAYEDAKI